MPEPLAGLPLPSWLEGAVTVQRLGAGPVSDSWRLRTRARDVVLRRDRPLAAALALERGREARVLQLTSGYGLAPEPLWSDPPRGVLVTMWIDETGRRPEAGACRPAIGWHGLGSLLRRVHELPVEGVTDLDLPALAERYRRVAGGSEALALARRIAERAPPLFAGAPTRLCHNDAHLGNVVGGSSPLLLDWEYAAVGHPLFDLAAVAGFHALDDPAVRRLLGGWAGDAPLADIAQFPAFLDLYRDVATLWARAVAAAS